jgi:hypothetical protein
MDFQDEAITAPTLPLALPITPLLIVAMLLFYLKVKPHKAFIYTGM